MTGFQIDLKTMHPTDLVVETPDDHWKMVCPYCGDDYVHHTGVRAFERDYEDGPSRALSTEDPDPRWIADDLNLNPSSRRNGLYIDFWAECGHEWILAFYQHKGQTFLSSRVIAGPGAWEQDLATMPYADYLKTDHWQTVRKAALERAEHRCQTCSTDEHLHVHHRTYENRGAERDSDVIVLCKTCHERFHGVTNGKVTHTVR